VTGQFSNCCSSSVSSASDKYPGFPTLCGIRPASIARCSLSCRFRSASDGLPFLRGVFGRRPFGRLFGRNAGRGAALSLDIRTNAHKENNQISQAFKVVTFTFDSAEFDPVHAVVHEILFY
jgi:hypothetical protein